MQAFLLTFQSKGGGGGGGYTITFQTLQLIASALSNCVVFIQNEPLCLKDISSHKTPVDNTDSHPEPKVEQCGPSFLVCK